VGLILGSGLNPLADVVEGGIAIPYGEIPHFPVPRVEGHAGRLILGRLEDQAVVVMQGRAHYYEGHSVAEVAFPVRVMQFLGIEILIVTNAAGGLNPAFRAGDVMLVRDHINLIGMCGLSPLRGPNLDEFGPRFPDMSEAYDAGLRTLARRVADKAGVPLHEGVYVCLAGPSFETPADLHFLRLIGADAVGMSTVPEVTIARHGGTRVLGISGISNVAPPEGAVPAETTHAEVLAAGQALVPRMEEIVRGVLGAL
jgi:purine-nucleoside phosphorylase